MTDPTEAVAYLDANVFIEAIEGEEVISSPIKDLFDAAGANRCVLVTSELTLAEVLGPSGGQARSPDLVRLYLDLIMWSRLVDLKPVSREILLETAKLRQFAQLRLPDAIHLATAIRSGCRFFVSRDRHFRQMPDGMEKITPEAAQLARVVESQR